MLKVKSVKENGKKLEKEKSLYFIIKKREK